MSSGSKNDVIVSTALEAAWGGQREGRVVLLQIRTKDRSTPKRHFNNIVEFSYLKAAFGWRALVLTGHLFLVFLTGLVTSISFLCPFSFDTPSTRTTVRTGEGEVDMFLAIETDNEGGNIDDLLANTNVSLSD
jgi:hypothetical protein